MEAEDATEKKEEEGAEKAEKEEKGEKEGEEEEKKEGEEEKKEGQGEKKEGEEEKKEGEEEKKEGEEEKEKKEGEVEEKKESAEEKVTPLMDTKESDAKNSDGERDYSRSKFAPRNVKPLMKAPTKPPPKCAFPEGKAVFPHILLKNVKVEVNFGQKASEYPAPEGYQFIHCLPLESRVRSPLPPKEKAGCTVIYMVGLPYAGKSTWVKSFLESEEGAAGSYNLLSAAEMLRRMTNEGNERNPRDFTFVRSQRFSNGVKESFQDKANKCLSRFLEMAARKRRNFIIEEKSNTYDANQRRKMAPFKGFKRRAVVITTEEEEFKTRRVTLEKEGSSVPDRIMNEIKMNFALPTVEEKVEERDVTAFEEVSFVGVEDEEKVKELMNKYMEEAKAAPVEPRSSTPGRNNFRGNDRGRNQGRYDDRRNNQGSPFQNRAGGGNFQRRDFNQGGGNFRGNYDNRNRGGFQNNRNQQQFNRGGFKQGQYGQGQSNFQNFNTQQQFQQNWNNYNQQQYQAGYGNTGYGQQVAQQGYGNYAAQGAQAGWTPQQQLWAQQWQQYYQQQAAAQRK